MPFNSRSQLRLARELVETISIDDQKYHGPMYEPFNIYTRLMHFLGWNPAYNIEELLYSNTVPARQANGVMLLFAIDLTYVLKENLSSVLYWRNPMRYTLKFINAMSSLVTKKESVSYGVWMIALSSLNEYYANMVDVDEIGSTIIYTFKCPPEDIKPEIVLHGKRYFLTYILDTPD